MLRYMRSSEPKGTSNTNVHGSPNSPGGSPKSPSSQSGTQHPTKQSALHQQQQQQQPPTPSARQLLAEAAKLPIPTSLRGATPGVQQTNAVLPKAAASSPKQLRHHEPLQGQPSVQLTRSNSDTIRLPLAQQQQMWEESSINSMFTDSVTPSARQSRRMSPNRYDSVFPHPRQVQHPHQSQHQQPHYEQSMGDQGMEDVGVPLFVGDRGVLRVLPTGANRTAGDDLYVERERPAPSGSPTRHVPVLKHSKYAHRDARDATRRPSLSDRFPLEGHEAKNSRSGGGGSPERRPRHRSDGLTKTNGGPPPPPTGGKLGLAGSIERDSLTQRLLFREMDAPLSSSRAPGLLHGTDDDSDFPSHGDEMTASQHTPRQERLPPRLPPQQPPQAVPQKHGLLESSLPRMDLGGWREQQPPANASHSNKKKTDKNISRKRLHSPDYDDSALHAMSYTALRDEPFDHDPARVAVQAAKAAAALSNTVPGSTLLADAPLEKRLEHYKSMDSNSQQQFFTELPVQEWDECGDWFLVQFAELSGRIRAQRQAKRRKIAAFEAEIAEREQTVRRKAESIERTLDELKHEGEGMMRGKVGDF